MLDLWSKLSTTGRASVAMGAFTLATVITVILTQYMAEALPLTEILFFRTLLGMMVIVYFVCFWLRKSLKFPLRILGWFVLNWITYVIGVIALFLSVAYFGSSETQAAYYFTPLVFVFLSGLFLGDKVNANFIFLFVLGMIGTLLILQPNPKHFGFEYLFPMFCVLGYSSSVFFKRIIGLKHQIEPQVQMFYQYAATVVVCIPLYFVFGDGKFEEEFPQSLSYLTVGWTMPSPELLALLFLMTAANLLLQYSYIYANTLKSSPAQIQNIQYLALPALVGLELLLFNDVPDQYVLLGVFLILVMGFLHTKWSVK